MTDKVTSGIEALIDLLQETHDRKIGAIRIVDPRWIDYEGRRRRWGLLRYLLFPAYAVWQIFNRPAVATWLEYGKWTQGGVDKGWGWWSKASNCRGYNLRTEELLAEDSSALARIEVALTVLEEKDAEVQETVDRVREQAEARREVAAIS
jgi:hypothetical protein